MTIADCACMHAYTQSGIRACRQTCIRAYAHTRMQMEAMRIAEERAAAAEAREEAAMRAEAETSSSCKTVKKLLLEAEEKIARLAAQMPQAAEATGTTVVGAPSSLHPMSVTERMEKADQQHAAMILQKVQRGHHDRIQQRTQQQQQQQAPKEDLQSVPAAVPVPALAATAAGAEADTGAGGDGAAAGVGTLAVPETVVEDLEGGGGLATPRSLAKRDAAAKQMQRMQRGKSGRRLVAERAIARGEHNDAAASESTATAPIKVVAAPTDDAATKVADATASGEGSSAAAALSVEGAPAEGDGSSSAPAEGISTAAPAATPAAAPNDAQTYAPAPAPSASASGGAAVEDGPYSVVIALEAPADGGEIDIQVRVTLDQPAAVADVPASATAVQ